MPTESVAKRSVVACGGSGNSPQGAEKRPPRVLVADDEPLMRWSIAETLAAHGSYVTEAPDAAAAMEAFPEIANASGVVLLDLCLPDSNDLPVLAAMHALSPSTPVILMTAQGSADLVDAAWALGAFAVIPKPFDLNDLIPLVHAASQQAG